jgi:hypothetical protein
VSEIQILSRKGDNKTQEKARNTSEKEYSTGVVCLVDVFFRRRKIYVGKEKRMKIDT